jgi:two-component system NtrC family sensor kinase
VVRDVPLLMLTGVDERDAMLDALSIGADDWISKSSDFDDLKARVRAQIRRKQFEDENRRIREQLLHKELEAAEARAAERLAEARAALADELDYKNRELEAFSYSVSHDLRAPLCSIKGFSRALLEEHADELTTPARDYVIRVRRAAHRMSELIDDLLTLSRISRSECSRERIDLSAIAQAVGAELQKGNPERRVDLQIEEGLVADADAKLMQILFENLLGNSWKFTAKVARAHIWVGSQKDGGTLGFFVRDDGAGFDPVHAEKLFRPFQRLHPESEFPGTGIGLATVRRIVERHGGRAWAEGEKGRGATFYFFLPSARKELAA